MGYTTVAGSTASQSPGGQYNNTGGSSGAYTDAAIEAAASAAASAAAAAASASTASVTSGTINGASIGASNPSTGKFTTLETTGNVGIGTAPASSILLHMSGNITGNVTSYGARITSTIQPDVTTTANIYNTNVTTAAASFTLVNLRHYQATNLILGAGSTVTTQTGFLAGDLNSGTNNYGFRSLVSAGTNKYGLYFEGTADNYLAGNTGIGVAPLPTVKSYTGFNGNSTTNAEYTTYSYMLAGATSGAVSKFAGTFVGQAAAGVNITGAVVGVQGNGNINGAGSSVGQLIGVLGAISTTTTGTVVGTTASFQSTIQNTGSATLSGALIGYHAVDHSATATGAVAAFYGGYSAAANKYNLCMAGTAVNLVSGDLQANAAANIIVTGTGGIGYGTGSGGSVTQTTSRTTNITSGIDKTNGSITLVSAAGTTAWQSFTVTNNKVAATDTVRVCQRSGTDLYMIHVTAVSAGSFRITFATTGGTTVEQPVFNFAVIKGVTA